MLHSRGSMQRSLGQAQIPALECAPQVRVRGRETETQRQRETESTGHRQTHPHIQTDTDRHINRRTHGEIYKPAGEQTETQAGQHREDIHRREGREGERQTDSAKDNLQPGRGGRRYTLGT